MVQVLPKEPYKSFLGRGPKGQKIDSNRTLALLSLTFSHTLPVPVLIRVVRHAAAFRSDFAALLSYAVLAVLYSWPLPTRFDTAFLGSPAADLGAYVWNLWVFRHEIVVSTAPRSSHRRSWR